MGYQINSLGNLPIDPNITLYIFVLNGGWSGGRYEMIENNFSQIAKKIGSKAIIVKGSNDDFTSEISRVYLGKDYRELSKLLPALLLTDKHPDKLKEESLRLLIPLQKAEERVGDLENFFRALSEFAIHRNPAFLEQFKDKTDWFAEGKEMIELRPNFFGIGVNLNHFIRRWRRPHNNWLT